MASPRVMLVGQFAAGALEISYASAFREAGCEVHTFDIRAAEQRHCRLGKWGRVFNRFVPVDPWIQKANREMVLLARQVAPDIVVVVGRNRVQTGALAQIRAISAAATVFIWPDTLVHLAAPLVTTLPLYDWVGTYSRSTVPVLERLGARRVAWLPLAGNPQIHAPAPPRDEFRCDVAFVGQWRPERDAAMTALLEALPGIRVKIWGPDWGRRARSPRVVAAWQKRALYGREFAEAVASATISLNVIDDTNYPAANMRFFEIPCAGGLQVCSPCPEMASEFEDGRTILYYDSVDRLPRIVERLLADDELRHRVASAGREKLLDGHTFAHRVRTILSNVTPAAAA